MGALTLDRNQTKTIAQGVYGDIKGYCSRNIDRYFPYLINDIRQTKGKPLLKTSTKKDCACDHPCTDCGFYGRTDTEIDVMMGYV